MERPSPKQRRQARLPLALGICMLLGSFGSCKGMAELSVWDEPVEISLPRLSPPEDAPSEEWDRLNGAWSELERAQTEAYRNRRPASNALAAVNLISSLVLMLGAMGTGARIGRGVSILRAGIVLSQAYVILGLVVGTWLQLSFVEAAQGILGPLTQLEGWTGKMALLSLIVYWLGIPLAAAALGAQFLFYVWMQRFLRRPETSASLEG